MSKAAASSPETEPFVKANPTEEVIPVKVKTNVKGGGVVTGD